MILRRPLASERALIVDFLAEHWRTDHLFVRDPAWLDWQHLSADGSAYHAICGFREDGRIAGFLGVMPLSVDLVSVSTGIWVVAKDAPDKRLGLKLFGALEARYGARRQPGGRRGASDARPCLRRRADLCPARPRRRTGDPVEGAFGAGAATA
jgi:hypothetical protein